MSRRFTREASWYCTELSVSKPAVSLARFIAICDAERAGEGEGGTFQHQQVERDGDAFGRTNHRGTFGGVVRWPVEKLTASYIEVLDVGLLDGEPELLLARLHLIDRLPRDDRAAATQA